MNRVKRLFDEQKVLEVKHFFAGYWNLNSMNPFECGRSLPDKLIPKRIGTRPHPTHPTRPRPLDLSQISKDGWGRGKVL